MDAQRPALRRTLQAAAECSSAIAEKFLAFIIANFARTAPIQKTGRFRFGEPDHSAASSVRIDAPPLRSLTRPKVDSSNRSIFLAALVRG